EIRDDYRRSQVIDRGERAAGELDPDPQLADQIAGLRRRPFRARSRRGRRQHEDVFGFNGGKPARNDRQRGDGTGAGMPDMPAEYRTQQTRLAETSDPRIGHAPNLPPRNVVRP